jgi:hypothetical protein
MAGGNRNPQGVSTILGVLTLYEIKNALIDYFKITIIRTLKS